MIFHTKSSVDFSSARDRPKKCNGDKCNFHSIATDHHSSFISQADDLLVWDEFVGKEAGATFSVGESSSVSLSVSSSIHSMYVTGLRKSNFLVLDEPARK